MSFDSSTPPGQYLYTSGADPYFGGYDVAGNVLWLKPYNSSKDGTLLAAALGADDAQFGVIERNEDPPGADLVKSYPEGSIAWTRGTLGAVHRGVAAGADGGVTVAGSYAGAAALVLDGYGGVHSLSARRPALNFYLDTDTAADLEVFQQDLAGVPGDIGLFVLDRTGQLWPGGAADPQLARDASQNPPLDGVANTAVDLLLADPKGRSGCIMDDHGAVNPFGGAMDPAFNVPAQSSWIALVRVDEELARIDAAGHAEWSGTPVAGWDLPMVDGDLLIDVELESGRGLVGLDRYGALYPTGEAILPPNGSDPPCFGFEAARDLAIGPPLGK